MFSFNELIRKIWRNFVDKFLFVSYLLKITTMRFVTEKDSNSLRLDVIFSELKSYYDSAENITLSASPFPVFQETFDMFVGNFFNLLFFIG